MQFYDFTTQLARTTDWWIAYDSLNFKIRRNQLEEQLKTCETKMIRATASYGRFHYIGKWLFIVGLIGLLLWINLYTNVSQIVWERPWNQSRSPAIR